MWRLGSEWDPRMWESMTGTSAHLRFVRTATTHTLRMLARRTGITARSGLSEECSLARARGSGASMGLPSTAATLILTIRVGCTSTAMAGDTSMTATDGAIGASMTAAGMASAAMIAETFAEATAGTTSAGTAEHISTVMGAFMGIRDFGTETASAGSVADRASTALRDSVAAEVSRASTATADSMERQWASGAARGFMVTPASTAMADSMGTADFTAADTEDGAN